VRNLKATAAVVLVLGQATPALVPGTAAAKLTVPEIRMVRMQAELDAQAEARARQADAFEAAATRIEMVNLAVAIFVGLLALGATLLGIGIIRRFAREQVEAQSTKILQDAGTQIFETESAALRREYDTKFANLYRRFERVVREAE
jgi:hypothetical protein